MLCWLKLSTTWAIDIGQIVKLKIEVLYVLVYMHLKIHIYSLFLIIIIQILHFMY